MGLTLVLGPANSAKAGEVLGAYAAAAPRGALLVVPTSSDARHYARELAEQGSVLGSVLTFSGLAKEIARRAEYPGRRLSDLQRARVLERVVARCDLDVLRASAGAGGFGGAAGELIAELQRSLVTPERFTGALRRWSAQDVRRAPYAREVGRLYADYVRECDRLGRVDRELYAWRALDALRAEPWRWSRPSHDAVFFYGFDDLTPLERDAVETLARMAGSEVTVSLTYEPGREAFSARAETVEELRPLAERVLELPAQDQYYAPASRAALHHLERTLFGTAGDVAEPIDPGDAVVLLEAGGERAEAELVAERVLELLHAGTPPGEIVIVHRSRQAAAPLLGQVFTQYGIPLHTGEALPLGHTPLGRGVLAAARCALDPEATAQDLLTYLRTPGRLERPEIADGLDADVRRTGLRTAAQARAALGWELPELADLALAADPAAEVCRLARRLFAAPHRGDAPALAADETLDARALRTLVTTVEELAELRLTPPPAELIALLDTVAVAPAPAGVGPDGAERVRLAEPLEVRARRFGAVFVCGLQEGAFPLPARPEPFLSDERRRELALASGLALRPREDALAAERYLFYAAVSRATERVLLAYRSSDEEGNLALPSPFIADVAELLVSAWRGRRDRRLLADVVWPVDRAPTEREAQRARAAARAKVAGEAPPPRRVLGAQALADVRHSHILSAGALEAYGDCPVRWLIERELQPDPLEPQSDAITRGTLMHDVLERLLQELGAPLTPATLAPAREILERLLAALAREGGTGTEGGTGSEGGTRTEAGTEDPHHPVLAPGEPPLVRAGALRAIEADLRRYLEYEAVSGGGWRPLGLELRFGFEGEDPGSLPPLQVGEGEERVLLRGMIDRVDGDGRGHAVVRDYKSGTRRPEWSGGRWTTDRRLQVALYMLVVRELLDLDPVGGFYQPLRGDDLRARGVFVKGEAPDRGAVATDGREPGEVEAMLADAAQRTVALAASLRSGELTPCPQTCSRDGCAYPAICRSQ